jgi:hypothetical protein
VVPNGHFEECHPHKSTLLHGLTVTKTAEKEDETQECQDRPAEHPEGNAQAISLIFTLMRGSEVGWMSCGSVNGGLLWPEHRPINARMRSDRSRSYEPDVVRSRDSRGVIHARIAPQLSSGPRDPR